MDDIYACRPAGKPSFYDKKFPGLYNASRDNLERLWNEQFRHHHAIMVVVRRELRQPFINRREWQ